MADNPTSQQVAVFDPYGNLGTMDASEARDAIQNGGFKVAAPDDVRAFQEKQQYGSGLGNSLAAGAAGFGRGATFGLSDQLLTKTGLASPEGLAALKKYNPISSGVGEFAGIAGMLAAPELGAAGEAAAGADALGALATPVQAVTKAGRAVSEAAAPFTEKAAGLLVNPETSPLVHQILSRAGSTAIGSSIEGAAYGLGQAVSEDALGDPDALGEKLLSHIGYGALLGGGFGAALGVGESAFGGKSFLPSKIISEADQPGLAAGELPQAAEAAGFSPQEKKGILEGLKDQKENADEIRAAASRLGAPVLESQTSASKYVQDADSLLLNGSSPTWAAMRRQGLLREGLDKVNSAVEDSLESQAPYSKAELGDVFKQSLSSKISEENSPISQLYNTIKEHYQAIPLSDRSAPTIARNIGNIDEVRLSPSSPQAKIASRVIDEIGNLKTVDDVKRYRTMLNQSLSPTAAPGEKRIVAIISDKLKDLEENSIVRFAENEMKTGVAKDRVMSLLDQRAAADTQYKALMGKVQRLGEALGKRRVYGPSDFIDFLHDLTPEKVTDKLFTKNNSGFLKFFSENFPEEMNLMRDYQRGLIKDIAMKSGEFKPMDAIKAIDNLEPEIKKALFTPEELQKVEDAKTYLQSLPKNVNPSGTSHASAARSFFDHPAGAILSNVRDYGIEKFVKHVGSFDPDGAAKVASLAKMERFAQKQSNAIETTAKSIFSGGAKAALPIAAVSAAAQQKNKSQNPEKIMDSLQDLNSNPEKMIDHLDQQTRDAYQIAPNSSMGIQTAAARATQFLGTKVPQMPPQKPLGPKLKPAPAQVSKFMRYYGVVQNPIQVLDQVRAGTVTPESMEALTTVYPKLYQEMRASVADHLTDHMAKEKTIPYRTRMALSMFMGADLDGSANPISVAMNQSAMAQIGISQANNPNQESIKSMVKGMKNMTVASRMLTPMQSVNQRENG